MAVRDVKTWLLSLTALTLLPIDGVSPVVYAQEAMLEEIVVTARRREESVRDVPATVTVISGEMIERGGTPRAEDFISMVPGVTMVDAAEVGDVQVNIRGINGARDAENSFALVIDGILMTNPAAFNRAYSNVAQVEVLKGPQGAIYGRNAAAGAIIVTTREPGNELGFRARASVAEDSTTELSATIGGPLTDDGTLFGQVHVDYSDSDGYYTNVFQNADVVDDFEDYNIGGRLMIEPSDRLSIDIKARYGEVEAAAITFNAAFALPSFASAFAPVLDPLFGDGFASFFDEDVNDHNFLFQGNIDPINEQEALEFSVKFDYDLEWATLIGWVLHSDIDNEFTADGTSGAFGFFNTEPTCLQSSIDLTLAGVTLPPPQILLPVDGSFGADPIFGPYTPTTCDGTQFQVRNQEDTSFELRLESPGDQRLRWLAGIYYLTLDREVGVNLGIDLGQGVTRQLFVPQGGSNPTEQLVWDDFDTTVTAAFGELSFDFTDDFEGSLALRYDREKREVTNLVPTNATTQFVDFTLDGQFTGGAPLNPGLDPSINPLGSIPDKEETFNELQPKVSFSWDVSDAATIYGSWGVGFKSGGFNNQGSNATVNLFFNGPLGTDIVIEDQFDEETSDAYELGIKTVLGERVRLEAAAYRVDVEDMQFFEFLVGPFGLLRVVSNIDDVEITGFELDVAARVTDWLDLRANGSVIDSEIQANSSRPATVGNESPYTPEFTAAFGAVVDAPISERLSFVASLNWSFIGDTWFHTVQDETRPTLFELGFPGLGTADYTNTQRDSFDLIDVQVGLRGEHWSASVFADNATDEDWLQEVIPAPEFGGSFIHPGTERRYGVEFTYDF